MRAARMATLLLLPALLIGASAASAQDEANKHERKGFWIGLGLGAGSLGDEDFANWETGLSGRFMIGGSFGPNIKVGYEGNSWVKDSDGLTMAVAMGGLTLHWYPSTTGGFHGILGAGFGTIAFEGFDEEYGGAGFVGAGYDLRLGRSISLTPYGTFNGGFFDGGQLYLISVGAAVTFH